ncbi:MAG: hypothetical protein IT495_02980 [Gammaproteobacteria bacterium]|nr:hypothetical protein [Gammaproteobacteria bacterium]
MNGAWDRRRVLRTALGLAGAGAIGALAPRGAAMRAADVARRGTPALILVQDGRYAASRGYATARAPQALRVLEARADLARQWYGELRALAARTPLQFAGLTSWSDFLVMRGCAAECGLRAATHELVRAAGGTGCTLVRWQIAAPRGPQAASVS